MVEPTYRAGVYRGLEREAILRRVRADGWDPIPIADPAGAVYPPHRHPQAKLLAFLAGSMEVRAGGRTYRCAPGDELVIPGDVEHAARVGPEGCAFLWSEQLRDGR